MQPYDKFTGFLLPYNALLFCQKHHKQYIKQCKENSASHILDPIGHIPFKFPIPLGKIILNRIGKVYPDHYLGILRISVFISVQNIAEGSFLDFGIGIILHSSRIIIHILSADSCKLLFQRLKLFAFRVHIRVNDHLISYGLADKVNHVAFSCAIKFLVF